MKKNITGKVTHIGTNNQGNVDSVLINVGHEKTLTVKYNDKHFGGELVGKGNVINFECDSIHEVDFEDVKTGEIKPGNYLEATAFSMLSQREPEVRVHRKEVDLGAQPQSDAPHPAESKDPAQFNV